jgi:CubicO group peptidase (beta-lactamase class C family)
VIDLDAVATEAALELGVPGAQIAVLVRGELATGETGVASVVTDVTVTPDTLFQIGSTTKLLTAVLVMQLVDEGALDLDRPVIRQLPGFQLADATATNAVTPRHLLTMSSGIDNGPYADYGRGDDAVARYVEALASVPHSFPPGEGFGYSNASTVVSGRLVEHLTGGTWDAALSDRVLTPAGLADTASLPEDVVYRRFAIGHDLDGAGPATARRDWTFGRSMGPAGSTLCSTASDLVRLAHVFLHGGVSADGQRILSESAAEAMQQHHVDVPPIFAAEWWGLGPYGKMWDGVEVLGHMGTNLGGASSVVWSRELDLAVATTVNAGRAGSRFAMRIFENVFRDVAGIQTPLLPPPSGRSVDNLDRYVGRYEMSGSEVTVSRDGDTLLIARENLSDPSDSVTPSPLQPVSRACFLPADPRITHELGCTIAFAGPPGARPTHLLNGFFALRRVTVDVPAAKARRMSTVPAAPET